MKGRAVIEAQFADTRLAEVVYKSLAPDVAEPLTERAHVKMSLDGTRVIVEIDAKDLVMLRALANSFLRLLSAVLNTINELHNNKGSQS